MLLKVVTKQYSSKKNNVQKKKKKWRILEIFNNKMKFGVKKLLELINFSSKNH